MKVYLVYWCNNETYEDYYESVDKVFSTYGKAVEYIESQGYKLREKRGKWEIAHDIVRWDAIEDDGFGTVYSMWVREMEVGE